MATLTKSFDVKKLRAEFPILNKEIYGKPLVYLDNAATTQKPKIVIDAINDYYTNQNSNIHRGLHYLSEHATDAYELARTTAQTFINAKHSHELIFVRGTTEAINLVAATFGRANIKKGDEIIISELEHHSNIVPWQILCEEKEAILKVLPINESGEILVEKLASLISEKTKLVAVNHISNSLGSINPVKEIIDIAHAHAIPVLIDGAQAAPHLKIDVQDLDCDFYTFSGHKVYGPTGVGILYGKEKYLDAMPPYQGGGEMIKEVTFNKTTYNDLPHKFEAGTPNIAGGICLRPALKFIEEIGQDNIAQHEAELLEYAMQQLKQFETIRFIGTAQNKAAVISFLFSDIHALDLGTLIDKHGIAIRTGHHCTQPVMQKFGVPATARASFALYNTKNEIDIFIDGIKKARKMLL